MIVTVLSVGTVKEASVKEAIEEYKKRLSAFARVEEISLKEARLDREETPASVEAALRDEGARLLSAVPAGAYRIALCVEGEMPSSEALARRVGEVMDGGGKLALIIGSSHGLSPELKAACDYRLSLSRLTMPHQLCKLFLFEALYRSFSILAHKKYHK